MTTSLKLRRGTTAQHASFTGAEGEVTVDTTKDTVVVHDGATAGGFPLAKEKFVQTGTGAVARTVDSKLKDTVSVKDFGAIGNGITDDTAAFTAALTAITAGEGTLVVPQGTYLITDGLDLQRNCSIVFAPGTNINFNSTSFYVLQVHRGTTVIGNNVRINIINATWNGGAIFMDGVHRFADDEPTLLKDISVNGIDNTKGTGLYLTAEDAADFITFVRFNNFAFYNLNFGLTLSCGTGGTVGDYLTWHWINSNIFENFSFYGVRTGLVATGLNTVPAEVAGNSFTNFQFQTSAASGTATFSGASSNFFDAYIWDFNYAGGDAIIFTNGAQHNQVHSNITLEGITGATNNKVTTFSGQESGNRDITGNLTVGGNFGVTGSGSYDGNQWLVNGALLQGGYNAFRWSIGGTDELIITPRSGYQVKVAGQFAVQGKAIPAGDNTYSIGEAPNRWSVVYAATGTINTSDERSKQQIGSIDEAVFRAWSKVEFLKYKLNDAVEEKGDGARWHFGLVAQRVKEAFESEGLDPFAYGLLCFDRWDEKYIDVEVLEEYVDDDNKVQTRLIKTGERKLLTPAGERYGIRYEEALALECAYLRSRLGGV